MFSLTRSITIDWIGSSISSKKSGISGIPMIRTRFLKSHCIPQEAYPDLENENAEAFIETRRMEMISREAEFMKQFDVEPAGMEENDTFEEPEIDAE